MIKHKSLYDSEAPVIDIWGMWSTPLLSLLPMKIQSNKYVCTLFAFDSVAFWLVNACNIKYRRNHDMRGNRDMFSGKKVYTIERLLVDKNIGLVNTE